MQLGHLLNQRYRIEKELAAGGFGQTFIATDTHLPSQPQVVVKLLKPLSNDPATLQIAQRLFKQEAEILEKLGKDNDRIPSLYAYFELDKEFYLVQEFIDGTVLTEELGGNKLSVSATLSIIQEILTGLNAIHCYGRGVIHRDLKPDNIIRRKSDRKLVLIDFGAVKQVRAASATTPITVISQTIGIGTPGYMPNEQGMGFPKPASDIYAVGAIAIQCLTGSHPYPLFDEDSLKLKWQHLCQVNRGVADVLEKMIEPDSRQRYTNATETLNAIESLISVNTAPKVQQPTFKLNTGNVRSAQTAKTTKLSNKSSVKSSPTQLNRQYPLKWWLGSGVVGALILAIIQYGRNLSLPDTSTSPVNVQPLATYETASTTTFGGGSDKSLSAAEKTQLTPVKTALVMANTAIKGGDVAKAKTQFAKVSSLWTTVEPIVKAKAGASYPAIVSGIEMVKTAMSAPTPDKAKAGEGLTTAINGINAVLSKK